MEKQASPIQSSTNTRTLTTLSGNYQKLDGGAMFGNAPRALWQRWFPADEHNRIDLGCRALLVQEPGRNVLVEAGIGAFFSPEMKERYGVEKSRHILLDKLALLGLSDSDIDANTSRRLAGQINHLSAVPNGFGAIQRSISLIYPRFLPSPSQINFHNGFHGRQQMPSCPSTRRPPWKSSFPSPSA